MTFNPDILQAGDVLLYKHSDLVGLIIALKTWKDLSHVEGYIGGGKVVAARAEGVGIYPVRVDQYLVCVRRPYIPPVFDTDGALGAVKGDIGKSYEVGGLLRFFEPWAKSRAATRICSSIVTKWLRGGGCEPFNPYFEDCAVSPAQLYQTGALRTIWYASDSYRMPMRPVCWLD